MTLWVASVESVTWKIWHEFHLSFYCSTGSTIFFPSGTEMASDFLESTSKNTCLQVSTSLVGWYSWYTSPTLDTETTQFPREIFISEVTGSHDCMDISWKVCGKPFPSGKVIRETLTSDQTTRLHEKNKLFDLKLQRLEKFTEINSHRVHLKFTDCNISQIHQKYQLTGGSGSFPISCFLVCTKLANLTAQKTLQLEKPSLRAGTKQKAAMFGFTHLVFSPKSRKAHQFLWWNSPWIKPQG